MSTSEITQPAVPQPAPAAQPGLARTARLRVGIFLAALVPLTLAAWLAGAWLGESPLARLLMMWTPALAALVASLLTRRSLAAIGWKPWPLRWLALGWLLPVVYAVPAYALVWLSGLGGVPNPTFLERARLTLGAPAGWSDGLVIAAAFGYITLVNLLPAMLLSLGEEIGWRGFLVPELDQAYGFRRAALWSGLIWAAWHLPGILSGGYRAGGTPLAYQLVCFTLLVLSSGVLMAWLRLRSGSLWPVAILHATHNGLIQAFLDRLTYDTGATAYFTGEFGAALLFTLLPLAWMVGRGRLGNGHG